MKTICYITNQITGNFHQMNYRNVIENTKSYPCNVIVYEGGIVNRSLSKDRINQQILFDFIQPDNMDGIILSSGSMLLFSSQIARENFMKKHESTPLISLYTVMANTVNVRTDNEMAITRVISHLREEHGLTRFAFVNGPADNQDCKARKKGFIKGLKLHGIPPEEGFIFEGDLRSKSGKDIISRIIHENMDIEAVLFANDEMAIGALEYISNDHPHLVGKYAITGFDNVNNGALTNPQLTTVGQPLKAMIHKSVDLLLKQEITPGDSANHVIPSELVIRSSCGCDHRETKRDNKPLRKLETPINRPMDNIRTFDLEDLFHQLTVLLREYQLDNCFISFFEKPVSFEIPDDFVMPEKSNLKYSFCKNIEKIFEDGITFPSRELLPRDIKLEEPYALVAKPLFFYNEVFGTLLHDAQQGDEEEWENIRSIISNAVKGHNLIDEKNQLVNDLNEALQQVKQLKGLLPICAKCKNIRDDKGYWSRIEHYISENSEAAFTHSICPDCAEELYGYKQEPPKEEK
ncbi:MAG: substrate-binding domain-containing protein [Spirochaetaceae bacterium]|jgi:DNA-binding LacI/PurR family transcriptional regulator|nr:substrate-binding domain-containing protein [Spirochaetaceae bacterium]